MIPALKSTSQPAYQNLAAGTASASSIVSAVELKRERLLFQNLKAGRGLEGEDTLFFPTSNYYTWYEKSTSPPAIQNLIR